MKRYRLPEALGGREVLECPTTVDVPKGWRAVGLANVDVLSTPGWLCMVPATALTELPPPTPAEPPDGAIVKFGEDTYCRIDAHAEVPGAWFAPRSELRFWWGGLCKTYYPGITPVLLVPAAAEVELPWDPDPLDPDDLGNTRSSVRVVGYYVHDENCVGRVANVVRFTADDAEAKAHALLTAARAARKAGLDV